MKTEISVSSAGVIEALPVAAAIVDDDGILQAANQPWKNKAGGCFGLTGPVEPGADLLARLCNGQQADHDDAKQLIGGFESVLAGRAKDYQQNFVCGAAPHSPAWVRVELRAFTEPQGQPRVLMTFTDVTAEYEAGRALLESESRYHAVVEDQLEMICRFTPDTTLTFVNQAYCSYFGKTREELIGQRFLEFVPENERRPILNKLGSFAPDRNTLSYEHPVTRPDGSPGWQSWTDRAFFDQDGRVKEFQSVGRDITEHRLTQEALRESETRFNQLADHLDGVFWIFDWQSRKMLYVSPAYENVFGHCGQDVLDDAGQWNRRVHPNDLDHAQSVFRSAGDAPFDLTYRIVRADGEVRWVRDRGYPVQDDAGRVIRIVGLAEDITERVLAGQKVHRSEERYRAASEARLDAFFLFDPVRDDRGEIVDFVFADLNQRGAEMVSRTREEVIGQRLCELLPVNRGDMFFGAYKRVAQTGEPLSREFPIDAADEGIHAAWMEQQVVRVGDGIAISARDISARKRNELEIARQREENQTILDAIPALVIYKDTQNNILRVNKAACQSAGLPAEQIEGRHSAELYPEAADAYYEDDLAVIRSGRPKLGYIEKLPGVNGGEDRWLRSDKVPLYDNQRRPVGVILIAMDVTELKQTSEKLRGSEQRYRDLFDRVPVGVIEHDLSALGQMFDGMRQNGVLDFHEYLGQHPEVLPQAMSKTGIISANQVVCQLFDAKDHVEVIEAIRDGRIRPDPAALELKLGMVWNGQVSGEIETHYRTLSGRMIDVLLRIVIPEVDGRPDLSRVLLAMTDISANRQRLFAQAQVTHAERERRMLGHELHDTLAQQLTGINMLTESLRRRLASQNIPEADRVGELAGMVGQANTEVRRLISGLSSERITGDELETALESLADRTALVHQVPVAFVCRRAPDELSDEAANHLLFIGQEAAHNAAKHARSTKIEITLDQCDTCLTLTVTDDGVGLPPEGQRPAGQDSGLGMNIMRYRAQAIGASVRFDRPEAGGTAVVCRLPIASPMTSGPTPTEPAS